MSWHSNVVEVSLAAKGKADPQRLLSAGLAGDPGRAGSAEKEAEAVHHYDDRAAFVADDADGEGDLSHDGKGNQHHDRAHRDNQVLTNHAAGALAEAEGSQEVLQPVVHQNHVRLFEGGIRAAGTHRDADIGGGQARGIVDAVAYQCHAPALLSERANGLQLLLWLQLGAHILNPQLDRKSVV